MRNVKLDRNDPLDLYEQVAGEIRRAIADGEAKPGERLPPAKDLAAELKRSADVYLAGLRQVKHRRAGPRATSAKHWLRSAMLL